MALKSEYRKEKSLGILTQNFVKLFLCSCADLISLEEAAQILLGDGHNTSVMRTKVRCLYDIANVLSSMNFIENILSGSSSRDRKPAFRWLGMKIKAENRSKMITFPMSLRQGCSRLTFPMITLSIGIRKGYPGQTFQTPVLKEQGNFSI